MRGGQLALSEESRWIMVSNRLPYQFVQASQSFQKSAGGLVSAINGIHANITKRWLGLMPTSELAHWQSTQSLPKDHDAFFPIGIDDHEYDDYYNGFCNAVLWPLFHYQSTRVRFCSRYWASYQKINRLIAEHVVALAKPTDLIWIHDFQLCLVPQYIKALNPNLKVGWFLHIPFPSAELYLELPVRHELLHGILSADLVGFQDARYLHHFCSSVQRAYDIEINGSVIEYNHRRIQVGVFPVSIDYAKFHDAKNNHATRYMSRDASCFNFLGVDRMDYIKGIDLKIDAFATLLRQHPERRGKVCLVQIAIPSREQVSDYKALRVDIEQQIDAVNEAYYSATNVKTVNSVS